MKKVYVFLAEGFEEMEAIAPVDLLRRAGVDASFVSLMREKWVKGSHGVRYEADLMFAEADFSSADMLVLPGGGGGANYMMGHKGLKEALSLFAEGEKWIAAICAAPMVLGDIGVLSGKHATIYPGMEEKLIGAIHEAKPVVVDGNIITGRGPGAATAFGLALVAALAGEEMAEKIRTDIVYQA